WRWGRLKLWRRYEAQALLRSAIISTRWSSSTRSGAGNGSRLNVAMLRLSHCQTALFGNLGRGSGGGGRDPTSPARDECSDPAKQQHQRLDHQCPVTATYASTLNTLSYSVLPNKRP
ncbi:hypothetical protein BDFB_008691, partial [Asbolus verrucosus]